MDQRQPHRDVALPALPGARFGLLDPAGERLLRARALVGPGEQRDLVRPTPTALDEALRRYSCVTRDSVKMTILRAPSVRSRTKRSACSSARNLLSSAPSARARSM